MDNNKTDFEERKTSFLKELSNYAPYILPTLQKDEKGLKVAKIILDPKDDLELNYAKSYLRFGIDTATIIEYAMETNNIDIRNSTLVDYLCSYINAVVNDKKDAKVLQELVDSYNFSENEKLAQLYYEAAFALTIGREQLMNEISRRCSMDFNNPEDVLRCQTLLANATGIITFNDVIYDTSRNGMMAFIEFANIYHKYIDEKLDNTDGKRIKSQIAEIETSIKKY